MRGRNKTEKVPKEVFTSLELIADFERNREVRHAHTKFSSLQIEGVQIGHDESVTLFWFVNSMQRRRHSQGTSHVFSRGTSHHWRETMSLDGQAVCSKGYGWGGSQVQRLHLLFLNLKLAAGFSFYREKFVCFDRLFLSTCTRDVY